MSEEIATPSVVDTNVGATNTPSAEQSVPETPVLPVQDYANYVVPIKLDGEELQVPLSEAIAGYQRQADYTRKTQELAAQREQVQFASTLQAALERDPEATIDLLMRHYGVSRAEARAMAADVEDTESLDPAERKLREMESRIAQFEEYKSQQEVEREISRLQSKYADFNVADVVNTALRLGTSDLEGTYKQMAYDRMVAQQAKVQAEAAAKQQAVEQQVVEAKRQAAVVSGGSNPAASTTTESVEPITNIRDAWSAAKRQLGAN